MADKKTYCSVQQKNKLVELVSAEEDLVAGKFSSTFSYKDSQKRWTAIAEAVNAIPGANKDWRHWRKTWQDIRSKTKTKQARLNKYVAGTGGGPSQKTLTKAEEIVLCTINAQAVSGNTAIIEGDGRFQFVNAEHEDLVDIEVTEEPEDSDIGGETIYVEYYDEQPAEAMTVENEIRSLPTHKFEKAKITTRKGEHLSTPSQVHKGNIATTSTAENEKIPTPATPRTSKAKVAAERLQCSSHATGVLAEVSKKELALKEYYYNKKLEYLERQTTAMEKIADALGKNVF